MAFTFGFDVDNHAVNSVPKETLVRITKAEDGGMDGRGVWLPSQSGYSPSESTPQSQQYLTGAFVQVRGLLKPEVKK
jgi:nitrate reductase alpha subunit